MLNTAKYRILIRGYGYFISGRVLNLKGADDSEYKFTSTVKGDGGNSYDVELDSAHPEKSTCTCPFAKGGEICKHITATYFAAYPEEAKYMYENEYSITARDEDLAPKSSLDCIHQTLYNLKNDSEAQYLLAMSDLMADIDENQSRQYLCEALEKAKPKRQ